MLLRPSFIKLGKDEWLEEGLIRAGGVVGGDGGLEGSSLLMILGLVLGEGRGGGGEGGWRQGGLGGLTMMLGGVLRRSLYCEVGGRVGGV